MLLSWGVYYVTKLERKNTLHTRLQSRASYTDHIYTALTSSSFSFLDRINTNSSNLLPGLFVGIYSLNGTPVYEFDADSTNGNSFDKDLLNAVLVNNEYFFTKNKREGLAYFPNINHNKIIIISAYDEDGFKQLSQLRRIFIICFLVGVAVAFLTGLWFSSRLLQPVRTMINEVNDISAKNLSGRIITRNENDELGMLAITFNRLLDRVQESFKAQNNFISNASHEFSTPLTSISSQLQVTLQRERPTEEYKRVMGSILEDVQNLLQLTKILLEIAKTGTDGNVELTAVRVDEVLFRIMSDLHKSNHRYVIELDYDSSEVDETMPVIFGNPDLMYISLKNIIENACKFSNNHTAYVTLTSIENLLKVAIKNYGNPIPEEEMNSLFHPFYRSSNSHNKPGFGLGLALTKRIIAMHKGTISTSSSKAEGTIFTISLPIAP